VKATIPVRPPFRLDYTVEALRRVRANVVDVCAEDGAYLRAFARRDGETSVVEVRQKKADEVEVRAIGPNAKRCVAAVARMLGTQVDLREWYRRVGAFPWLARLTEEFRGVKPPRYPTLWEALCHAIVFQQLSIVAASSIMLRFIQACSMPVRHADVVLYPFPLPDVVCETRAQTLQSLGLSRMKAAYLKSAAECVLNGSIDPAAIEHSSTGDAIEMLTTVHGIGRWTASVILLRGFGRLDVFPPSDSGAARAIKLLSGDPKIDAFAVLERLGSVRGMLYFHLLLGRLHHITPNATM
jgi:DNA-3-methyladenine glycosylase II